MKVCTFIKRYLQDVIDNTSGLSMKDPLSLFGKIDRGLGHIRDIHARGQDKTASWMTKTQPFLSNWESTQHLHTYFPIIKIKGFYCWKMPQHPTKKIDCDCEQQTCQCDYCVDCVCQWGKALELRAISWGAKPLANSYQVPWGEWSNTVAVYLAPECGLCNTGWCDPTEEGIYVEYYAGYNCPECLNDELPVPKHMLSVLADFVIADIQLAASGKDASQSHFNRAKNRVYASKDKDMDEENKGDNFMRILIDPIKGIDQCSGMHYMDY